MQFRVRITKERFEQLNYYSGTNSEKLYFGIDLEQFIKGIDFLKYTDESKGKPKLASTVEHDINNPMLNRLEKKILFQEKLSLYIHFDNVGNQLTLSILNKNIFTQTICFIYDCELPIPYYLMDTINMAAITINSYYFKDALNMLHPKCETISISISNQYPHLIVSGSNEYWSSEVGYSNHDSVCSEIILATQQERIIGYYRYKHLMEIYQGLNGSQKIKIIINELGFLVISFIIDDMLPIDNVMFFCSPIMTS
ncbi:hypothetical protein K502DRAFT_322389 [Neoconidiobolus thromboides FSU 785]|nr:hypothetical protein K502DRAFT_322389 [Neoconidiobolus thromboides FSU 785]